MGGQIVILHFSSACSYQIPGQIGRNLPERTGFMVLVIAVILSLL